MSVKNAFTARALSETERRQRLADLVAAGAVTPAQAALIAFREPPAAVRARSQELARKIADGSRAGALGAI